jgi:23S rRNA (guanine745-N1)-methyltransferase
MPFCRLSSILVIAGWQADNPQARAQAGVLDDVVGNLHCPHCGNGLTRTGGSLRCSAGHSFDIARQGYVSLLQRGVAGGAGDTAAMVRARREFLGTGHFAPMAAALADAAAASVAARSSGCVVDVGAGTGYYLAAVLARLPRHAGVALDVSKHALRVAARAHRRIGAVGCDPWRPLPVTDSAADLLLNVFAPRDGAEFRRILRPDGRLLLVTPAADHLSELTQPLGLLHVDERKRDRLAGKLSPHLAPHRRARAPRRDLTGQGGRRRTDRDGPHRVARPA